MDVGILLIAFAPLEAVLVESAEIRGTLVIAFGGIFLFAVIGIVVVELIGWAERHARICGESAARPDAERPRA